MRSRQSPSDSASTERVASELIRFVERVLVVLEVSLADALAAEGLTMSEVRLLMALERHDQRAAEVLAQVDGGAHDLPHRLRGLTTRGLVGAIGDASSSRAAIELTAAGRIALARLDHASKAALAQLIGGLDGPQRLRLQGAMHLIGDRFGIDAAAGRAGQPTVAPRLI